MKISALAVLIATGVLAGCGGAAPFPSEDELTQIAGMTKVHTPPRSPTNKYADSAAAAALGDKLFHDKNVSGCKTIACASCHVAPSFTVAAATPTGCGGNAGRNAPTLLNVAFYDWLGWDGRKDTVWAQPMFPLLNPVEMAGEPEAVRTLLQTSYLADYVGVFGKAPNDSADVDEVLGNFGKALDAYERTLIKVDAPFDDKLASFIAAAKAGHAESDPFYVPLKVFVRDGACIVCHKGPMLTDNLFHNLGLKQGGMDHGRKTAIPGLLDDVWNGGGAYSDDTMTGGNKLASLTALKDVDTDGAFKTPTLRNIAITGPYMHTGEVATLADVVEFYNRGGDPDGTFPGTRTKTIKKLNLSTEQKQALVDLLNTLTAN